MSFIWLSVSGASRVLWRTCRCLWRGWPILNKPLVFKCDCAHLLMPAVNSFSHRTWNPLAWSPGSERSQKEEVGCADYKEVSSQVQEGAASQCWCVAGGGHGLGFLDYRKVIFLSGCQALGIQFHLFPLSSLISWWSQQYVYSNS